MDGISVDIPSEDACKIEAEAVHMVLGRPIAKAFLDHVADYRMVAVHGIAAAGVILIASVRREQIIYLVVEAFKRNDRTVRPSFRRMVEDDVKKALDIISVQLPYHLLQLIALAVVFRLIRVAGVRRKEADGVVAPVIQQPFAVVFTVISCLIEFEYGHEFHGVDSESL